MEKKEGCLPLQQKHYEPSVQLPELTTLPTKRTNEADSKMNDDIFKEYHDGIRDESLISFLSRLFADVKVFVKK